jgi:hypothetical protein
MAKMKKAFFTYSPPSIIADRVDRAGVESFAAKLLFDTVGWLSVDEGVASISLTGEVVGRDIATDIAINTLAIDVIPTGFVLR